MVVNFVCNAKIQTHHTPELSDLIIQSIISKSLIVKVKPGPVDQERRFALTASLKCFGPLEITSTVSKRSYAA